MSASPAFRLSVQVFPQSWDGANLRLRILILPQGDPLSSTLPGIFPVPDSPAFADAQPKFVAQLIPSLTSLPMQASVSAQVALPTVAPAGSRPLFQQLASEFNIVPDLPGQTPRRTGFSISKYLPDSYRNAFNFDRPKTPFAVTDDSYHCLLENLPAKLTPQAAPPNTVSWGRVLGFALRQPLVSTALGLLYEVDCPLPTTTFYADGGWIYVNLDSSGDFAPQIAANSTLFQSYAARLPVLSAPRPLFAAVLFPVTSTPPSSSYDSVFIEAEEYDDGFAKIVHGSQPIALDLLDTSGAGLPPAADYGLRLGWDDEQITTWFNRQIDATQIDAPFGTAGYCIDVRQKGHVPWNSLCHVTGSLAIGTTQLGTFDGELALETLPASLDPTSPTALWLSSYFAQWRGGSVVVTDPIALRLHGTANPSVGQTYIAAPDATAVPLHYGKSYDVRVRLMDLSRGGPGLSDNAVNPGPAPIATIPFRRFVPFKPVTLTDLDLTATPATPQTSYQIARPLLNYPAVVFTGLANAVESLLADLPNAIAAGREAALPDPDAISLTIQVQVRQLVNDAEIYVEGDDPAPYSLLYQTTREFPADSSQPLQLDIAFQDVPDIAAFSAQPAVGALVLPRQRAIRLVFSAAAAPDPQLLYWGSIAATVGQKIEVLTGAYGLDESGIFTPEIEASRICGIMLQPDPVLTSNVAASLDVLGQRGTAPYDVSTRLALSLGLNVSGLTYTAQAGERILFGCGSTLAKTLSPDHGSITFATKGELTHHWLIVVSLHLARDWTWGLLAPISFEIRNAANEIVGTIDMTMSASAAALQGRASRSGTRLIFFDAIDPKPSSGSFPAELTPSYTVTPIWPAAPVTQDPPLQLPLLLPVAARPMQTPQLASAGIALTPYAPAADYSFTNARQRALWIEFAQPVADPDDTYFARVLSYAPDQILTGAPLDNGNSVLTPPAPPLPIDPELIRTIVPGQSDDRSGLNAMQPLIPSPTSDVHFILPLPTGLSVEAPELFGTFVYEFRVGHSRRWSTAQGRFGSALTVAGVMHPPPTLLASVNSLPTSIGVSAPYAKPVFGGRSLMQSPPLTQLWGLLYAQVTQADGGSQRNVLLDRLRLGKNDRRELVQLIGTDSAGGLWERATIQEILAMLALPPTSPLSVIVVETFKDVGNIADPLGGDLGHVRILRVSPLAAVPPLC
ncbi:MAG TPA: hypothetical protein VL752_01555 [Acidisoma sp.]|uniref:hypothetical protein n=1 Tax=Acidisoma sp. TaxID=1872115 RepID=UPI002D0F4F57|nr:hypothetical protein [Acidisoma sp.]HTH99604.1 hypothetical protein [Acidisoma sp.]